jgi:hypothetical protein
MTLTHLGSDFYRLAIGPCPPSLRKAYDEELFQLAELCLPTRVGCTEGLETCEAKEERRGDDVSKALSEHIARMHPYVISPMVRELPGEVWGIISEYALERRGITALLALASTCRLIRQVAWEFLHSECHRYLFPIFDDMRTWIVDKVWMELETPTSGWSIYLTFRPDRDLCRIRLGITFPEEYLPMRYDRMKEIHEICWRRVDANNARSGRYDDTQHRFEGEMSLRGLLQYISAWMPYNARRRVRIRAAKRQDCSWYLHERFRNPIWRRPGPLTTGGSVFSLACDISGHRHSV